MATTLIFGGSGKVARHITRLLAAEGQTVHSIIRNPDQRAEIEKIGGTPIVQSIEDSTTEDFVKTIQSTKPNTIIWAAGAGGSGGPERTTKVDQEGAIKTFDATAQAGLTKRLIIISAVDVRDKSKPEPAWYNDADRERSKASWNALGGYYAAKLAADKDLVTQNGRRGLEYTIVRPGRLSEDAATGKVEAGRIHISNAIPREDVAAAVVEVLKNDGTKGLAFDLVGGETPIRDAIAAVAKEKADVFEGHY